MQPRPLVRLVITLFAAWIIALIVSADSPAVWVCIIFWAGLYWLWKLWDHGHGNGVAAHAGGPRAAVAAVGKPQLPSHAPGPLWRRILWRTVKLAGGAVVAIVLMIGSMILYLGYCERQAKAERNKVQSGMTVDDVLTLVHGGCIRTHAVLPDNVSDKELVHYVSLTEQTDGTFWCDSCEPNKEERQLSKAATVELMMQKMADGYDWRWRYTFINATPQHFSFTVTFGRDGRVKDVTDVWGWD